jgi:bifunctional oligoribonuclease and PAP phosphatase NrnA
MQELISHIRSARSATVVAHIRPDGDAVGSVLGLSAALQQIGIRATPVLKDGVPSAFLFVDGSAEVQQELPADCDICIVVDAPDSARTGFTVRTRAYADQGKLLLIDHHTKGDLLNRAAATLHRESASSTAELIAELILAMGVKLTSSVSTALLTGMYTDTGGFQYGNTSTQALNMAGELMRRGGRLNRIVQHVARQRSLAGLKLLGIALSRLTLTPDRLGAITVLNLEDLRNCDASPEDAGGLVNSLNVLPEVRYCLLLTELEPGMLRGTLRTAEGHSVDVAKLAHALGGGGHPRAAGFSVPGHLVYSSESWRIEKPLVS